MAASDPTPTGGYGEIKNGREEVAISGWGAALMAKGTNVVAVVVLLIGLAGLGATNWYALRLMRDEIHDHLLTVDKSAAEGQQRKAEISEEHRQLVAQVRAENRVLLEAVQAAVWVLAQDDKTRRTLQLPEPPGIRRMRVPDDDVPIRKVK